jgi:release factor glutamine methyltransferase
MSSVRQAKLKIVHGLVAAGVEQAEAERESVLIIEHLTDFNTAAQMLHANQHLSVDQNEQVDEILLKRGRRMPLQYCLGYQWFMGNKFLVEPGVFIPRTDTETLVVVVKDLLTRTNRLPELAAPGLKAGEIGIGSGAISISLLKEIPHLQIVACDVSEKALSVACANAGRHSVGERLQLLAGDWTAVMPDSLNAIISNPPYIPPAEKQQLQPEVRDYEPDAALFGPGDDGLGFYRTIASTGRNFLADGRGLVAVEVGDGQSEAVRALFATNAWSDCQVHFDVNGLARVVSAWG